MRPFRFVRAADAGSAIDALLREPESAFIAGGTELVNWMRDGICSPGVLVDINALPLATIDIRPEGLRIGALARMSDVAADPRIGREYRVLAEALLAGASPQIRNMATIGGNLLQRTRCPYFRDTAFACNKRVPGSGCSALGGENRWHAILGTSKQCIAVHPSDLAVALLALDAVVHTRRAAGERAIPIEALHLLPDETPERETVLEHGELIVAIEVPATPFSVRSRYCKIRDRASYEFALVSVAVALDLADGVVRDARIALGGVAPKPWRAQEAEDELRGRSLDEMTVTRAAEAAVRGAEPRTGNAFKVDLVKRTLIPVLAALGREATA